MNDAQTFPFKCTYCGRSGKYKARSIVIAQSFKCPHDGAKLIVQEPVSLKQETYTTEVGVAAIEEVIEFTHKLSAAVVNKLKAAGARI